MSDIKNTATEKKTYKLILAFLSLAAQIAFVAFFFFGIATFGGTKIDLFGSIDLLLNLFSLNFVYYEIVGLLVGFAYIFVMVKLIINLIFSCKLLKLSCFDDAVSAETQRDALRALVHRMGNCVFWIACFTVTLQCLNSYKLGTNAILVIAIGAITYVASRFLIMLVEGSDMLLSASRGIFSAMVIAITLILLIITSQNAVQTMVYGLDGALALLQSNLTLSNETVLEILYRDFAKPVFYIIFAVSLLKIVDVLMEYLDYNNERALSCSKALIYKTAVFVVVAVVVECFVSGITTPESIIGIIVPHLPLILMTVALRLTFTFNNFEKKAAPSVATESSTEEDVPTESETAEQQKTTEE